MLGDILRSLTTATEAEAMIGLIGDPAVLERVQAAAAEKKVPVGALVASTVRHTLDHAGEDVWLDLLGVMSGSPQPGAAALRAILARSFPEPERVKIRRVAS